MPKADGNPLVLRSFGSGKISHFAAFLTSAIWPQGVKKMQRCLRCEETSDLALQTTKNGTEGEIPEAPTHSWSGQNSKSELSFGRILG